MEGGKKPNDFDIEAESNGTFERGKNTNYDSVDLKNGKIQNLSASDSKSNTFVAVRAESVEKKNAYFGNEGNRFWHFEIGNNRFPNQGEPDLPPDERF